MRSCYGRLRHRERGVVGAAWLPGASGCHCRCHRWTRSLAVARLVVMLVMVAFVDPALHGSTFAVAPGYLVGAGGQCSGVEGVVRTCPPFPNPIPLLVVSWRCCVRRFRGCLPFVVCVGLGNRRWDGLQRRGGGMRTSFRRTAPKDLLTIGGGK